MRDRFGIVTPSRLTWVLFRITQSFYGCLSSKGTYIHTYNLYVHQLEAVDRRKQTISDSVGDSNSGRSAVWHEFRSAVNIVQFSVMGPGVKRSHVTLAGVARLRTAPELPYDFASLSLPLPLLLFPLLLSDVIRWPAISFLSFAIGVVVI